MSPKKETRCPLAEEGYSLSNLCLPVVDVFLVMFHSDFCVNLFDTRMEQDFVTGCSLTQTDH